jgi:hypothetical protein
MEPLISSSRLPDTSFNGLTTVLLGLRMWKGLLIEWVPQENFVQDPLVGH